MPNAIALRPDFTASALRDLARRSKEAAQARRLLALAVIYDGGRRTEAAQLGNVTLQIVRDWVVRFNAEGPDGLRDRKAPGPTPRLSEVHRAALLEIIERGPTPAIHGVVRWRITDLGQWLWEEFRVSVSPQTLSRVLRGMGLRKLSARPRHHAQAEGAIAAFKKSSQPLWQVSRRTRASSPKLSRSGSPMRPE
jgi:transposase